MDHRDVAGHYRTVLQDVDTRRMTATFTVEDENGEEIAHEVRLTFEVCGTCDGRGTHVNPSIDSHGLTRDDFDEDPDFAEDYWSGRHDVRCAECGGERVVPVVDPDATAPEVLAAYLRREQDAWDDARETARARELGY
jgi:hypothetical protein